MLRTPEFVKQLSVDDTDKADFSTESHSAKAGDETFGKGGDGDVSCVTPFEPDYSPPDSPEGVESAGKQNKAEFYEDLTRRLGDIEEDSSSEGSQAQKRGRTQSSPVGLVKSPKKPAKGSSATGNKSSQSFRNKRPKGILQPPKQSSCPLDSMITTLKTVGTGCLSSRKDCPKFQSLLKSESPRGEQCTLANMHDNLRIPHDQHEAFLNHIFQSLEFINGLPEADMSEIQKRSVCLERKTEHTKMIIFDLDETLIHCTHRAEPEIKENSDVFLDI